MDVLVGVLIALFTFASGMLIAVMCGNDRTLSRMDDVEWSRHLEVERIKAAEKEKHAIALEEAKLRQAEFELKRQEQTTQNLYAFAIKLGKVLSALEG